MEPEDDLAGGEIACMTELLFYLLAFVFGGDWVKHLKHAYTDNLVCAGKPRLETVTTMIAFKGV